MLPTSSSETRCVTRLELRTLIKKLPQNFSEKMIYTAEKIEESLKGLLVPGMLFEELGFFYIGPIKGHDIKQLICTFKNIQQFEGPILIHILTKKGKGYKFSEEKPDCFHSTAPFEKTTGQLKNLKK